MRRFLIRLIALETMLVGWLGYWLFHVYANNPSVSQALASQLGRFPQLSFTTVDIAVLVIIAILSVFFAFKFQRGLRPGIRLERALQMLENLMKRNLVLEAQVAELRLEKTHAGPSTSLAPPESRVGSWERAFRTPIEAGPSKSTPPSRPINFGESSFDNETGPTRPTSKVEQRSASQHGAPVYVKPFPGSSSERPLERDHSTSEKGFDKAPGKQSDSFSGLVHSSWEDSPRHVSETGVLTPSPTPRNPASLIPVSSSKQPYIPVPVPKSTVPPNVIVGPGVSPSASSVSPQAKAAVRTVTGTQASPKSLWGQAGKPLESPPGKAPSLLGPVGLLGIKSNAQPSTPSSDSKPGEPIETDTAKEKEEVETKTEDKPGAKTLKKFSYEED